MGATLSAAKWGRVRGKRYAHGVHIVEYLDMSPGAVHHPMGFADPPVVAKTPKGFFVRMARGETALLLN